MAALDQYFRFSKAVSEQDFSSFIDIYRNADHNNFVPLAQERLSALRSQREKGEFASATSEEQLADFVKRFTGDDPAGLVVEASRRLKEIRAPRQVSELAGATQYADLHLFVTKYAQTDYANLLPVARARLAQLCKQEASTARTIADWRSLLTRYDGIGCDDQLLEARTTIYRFEFNEATSIDALTQFVTDYANFDPDGRVPEANSKLLNAKTSLQKERFAAAANIADWQSFVDTYRINDYAGLLPVAEKTLTTLLNRACLAASIPNLQLSSKETTEFFGKCTGSTATTGIVVRKDGDEAYDVMCLDGGKLQKAVGDKSVQIDAFKPCADAWKRMPDYCTYSLDKGTYHGQCKDGVAHGVGVWTNVVSTGIGSSDVIAKQGQFRSGALNGFARNGAIGGCGPVGCSGTYGSKSGWYEGSEFRFRCETLATCQTNLSGAAYLAFISRPRTEQEERRIQQLRGEKSFPSALAAFELTGDKKDLKRAESLASSTREKSLLEFTLVRLAGFENVFKSGGKVSAGGREVEMTNEKALLGMASGDSSSKDVNFDWNVMVNPTSINLKHGRYRLKVVAGLTTDYASRSCVFGLVCNDKTQVTEYSKTVDVILEPANRWRHKQNDGHTLTTAHAVTVGSSSLGSSSGKITGIHPFVRIDSIQHMDAL